MASTLPSLASFEGARRSAHTAGAALWVSSRSPPVRRWTVNTTGSFLLLLVSGPRSIGVIRAQTGVSRGRLWLASLLEGVKLSSLPTSSSCDKDGRHNLHNCTALTARGIPIDIIVALATLWTTAWGNVRDLEQRASKISPAWLLHGRCQTLILR